MGSNTATKIIGALAGFGLLVVAIAYYTKHADDDRQPAPRVITQLAGARLGMSPTDVTLMLGKPAIAGQTVVDANGDAHLIYVYTKDLNEDYALDITFHGTDRTNMQVAVICEKGGLSGILGFDRYSTELEVLRQLGPPTYTSVRSDGLEKAISYAAWNASFKIAQGKVVGICIHRGNFIQYDKEAPVMRQAGRNTQPG